MSQPKHTRALITGGARRLGRAIADHLKAAGVAVAVTTRTGDETGGAYPEVALDLDDANALTGAVDRAAKLLGGPVDLLVNCASRFEFDTATTVTPETLSAHMGTNLAAPILLTRAFAAQLPEDGAGAVVNILDYKLWNLHPDHLSYTLSKAALETFTRMAARALAPRIRVNGVAPGYTLPAPGQAVAEFERLHDNVPLGRGPTPVDIADAVAYLAGAAAVTGQTLIVDGGAHMMPQDRDFLFW